MSSINVESILQCAEGLGAGYLKGAIEGLTRDGLAELRKRSSELETLASKAQSQIDELLRTRKSVSRSKEAKSNRYIYWNRWSDPTDIPTPDDRPIEPTAMPT